MDFAIPTGNFGDIFTGYIAKQLLPEGTICKLVLATNTNDILSRFINEGDYSKTEVSATSSPSMDIQAASNFERYLFYLLDKNPERTKEAMCDFAENGSLELQNKSDHVKRDFAATAVSDEEVEKTIKDFKEDHNYLLDPHTAVGVFAAKKHQRNNFPMVCLATAHPAKFGDTVKKATGAEPQQPESIKGLLDKESRCENMAADKNGIKAYIVEHALVKAPSDE